MILLRIHLCLNFSQNFYTAQISYILIIIFFTLLEIILESKNLFRIFLNFYSNFFPSGCFTESPWNCEENLLENISKISIELLRGLSFRFNTLRVSLELSFELSRKSSQRPGIYLYGISSEQPTLQR